MKKSNEDNYKINYGGEIVMLGLFGIFAVFFLLPVIVVVFIVKVLVDGFSAVQIKIGRGGEIDEAD